MLIKERLILAVAACSLLITANIYAETGLKIKKCQDPSGRWHYGDTAAESCNQSKVTVINDKGLRVKEIAAPLTEAEINARARDKSSVDNERKRAEEQGKKDQQLLATYDNENQIIAARDRKLADLESQLRATSETLNTLRATLNRMQAQATQEKGGKPSKEAGGNIAKTESQIAKHEAALAETKKQQETVKSRYQTEFDRYLELKNPSPKAK
jgi:hypothetical protein